MTRGSRPNAELPRGTTRSAPNRPSARMTRAGLAAALSVALAAGGTLASGCKKKVTQEQCDQLMDHFADLVVKERIADGGLEAGDQAAQRAHELREAKHANEFRNCTSEVQVNEHDCAMRAQSSDALIKCLE
jgi:hypothetical protein